VLHEMTVVSSNSQSERLSAYFPKCSFHSTEKPKDTPLLLIVPSTYMYAGESDVSAAEREYIYLYIYAEECKRLSICTFARARERKTGESEGYHSGGARAAGRSEVSGGLGGEVLDAAGVTVFAEDVSVQRVAALVVPL